MSTPAPTHAETLEPISHPWETPPAEGAATEVAEGILWMRLPLPMALDHVNVYAFDDGQGWTLVDTGFHTRRGQDLWRRLLAGPLAGRPVERVLVTHHHPDHIGNAAWLAAETGAEIWCSRTAWLMARMLTLDVEERPSPEALAFLRAAGVPKAIYDERANSRPYNFADVVALLRPGFRRVRDGETLTLAGRRWAVWMGDGHAPDHLTLWDRESALAVTGDQILPGISPNLGVYPTEPDADPVAEWLAACGRLRSVAEAMPAGTLALPGHKLPFRGIPARLDQLIENHHGALDRLAEFLTLPKPAADCFPPLFRREIGEAEYGLALVETVAHLNHLRATGRAERQRRDDGTYLWRRLPGRAA